LQDKDGGEMTDTFILSGLGRTLFEGPHPSPARPSDRCSMGKKATEKWKACNCNVKPVRT